MTVPLAYFITFTTYGTWLHGKSSGSVDRQHNAPDSPHLPPNAQRESARREQMRQPAYLLDEGRRSIVLRTVLEVAEHRKWKLWAIHVRTNHVHIVITAECKPEKVMSDMKAWTSRRLREAFAEDADTDRWTQHGSTRYLWTESTVADKINYVLDEQGEPMMRFDGRAKSTLSRKRQRGHCGPSLTLPAQRR